MMLNTTPTTAGPRDFLMSHHQATQSHPKGLRDLGLHAKRTLVTLALTTASVAALGLPATQAIADSCPNAALRAENNSTNLPDCRAYELVSNPYKEGFAPVRQAYTDDGTFSYRSAGNFADNGMGGIFNQYVAARSATGWQTTAPAPSGPTYAATGGGSADALSADLRSSVWLLRRPDQATTVSDLYLRRPDGTFTRIGPGVNPATIPPGVPGTVNTGSYPLVAGASADLSHMLIALQSKDGYPGDTSVSSSSLYEYVGTGNDRPQLVGVDNTGHQISQGWTCSNGISPDGRVVFFTPDCAGGSNPQVWARIDGVTSVEASASECTRSAADPGGPCNGPTAASFAGAATDGSRVFFTTAQQLVNGDIDATTDLYACDIPSGTLAPVGMANRCASLRQVSNAAVDAQVESVAAVSDDGSRVYFVAQGVLAENLGANDVTAVAGDHNLYVWQQDAGHPSGKTTFVGRLDNDDLGAGGPQTTADGRFLVFSTATALVNGGPSADSDTAIDAYRYDAATGVLARLSTATSGDGGNESEMDATTNVDPTLPGRRRTVMTADGATIVFMTSEALSPSDTDGAPDAYAWHDGRVSLISSGQLSPTSSLIPFVWITASGTDIYFVTTTRLTPNDDDTNPDIYDARIGGGFAFPVAQACSGDACQGEYRFPPGLSGSRSDAPIGSGEAPESAPTFALQPVSAAQRKRLAATGKVSLTVTANTPGTVRAVATETLAGKSVGVGLARRIMIAPGRVTLSLALSKRARERLAAAGRLTIRIVVSDSKVALTRSTTLKLTQTKVKAKRSGAGGLPSRHLVAGAKGGRS